MQLARGLILFARFLPRGSFDNELRTESCDFQVPPRRMSYRSGNRRRLRGALFSQVEALTRRSRGENASGRENFEEIAHALNRLRTLGDFSLCLVAEKRLSLRTESHG